MAKISINNRRLYCILDLDLPYLRKDPVSVAEELIKGGADIIQLRNKYHQVRYVIDIGLKIRHLTEKNNIILIVNDRVDIAIAIGADGIHLGQEDLTTEIARRILKKNKIIGLSTHSLAQAKIAQDYDIDYISVGPIFRSPTKPELEPVGLNTLKRIVKISALPIVAIGGINTDNLRVVLNKGVDSIAVISGILRHKNIKQKTREFKKRINIFYPVRKPRCLQRG